MSDVEKITFDNQNRRRARESQNEWERRAAENARARDREANVRSWMIILSSVAYMAAGAAGSLCAVFTAMGAHNLMMTSAWATIFAFLGGFLCSTHLDR